MTDEKPRRKETSQLGREWWDAYQQVNRLEKKLALAVAERTAAATALGERMDPSVLVSTRPPAGYHFSTWAPTGFRQQHYLEFRVSQGPEGTSHSIKVIR